MNKYNKIQTIFNRNPNDNFKTVLMGEFSLPEFEYLKDNLWVFTEKVDGTNIRIIHENNSLFFKGKTDNARIQTELLNSLNKKGEILSGKMSNIFGENPVCLYGEGYGPKIQKGGGNYRSDQDFVLFDIKVGNWWFKREDCEDISKKLDIDIVPIIGEGNIDNMISKVSKGLKSQWGDFNAEGIVARPKVEFQDRAGRRIITKIKCKDFK